MEQVVDSSVEASNISNEQVDKFFESGGEIDNSSDDAESSEQLAQEESQQPEVEQEQSQEEKKPKLVNYEALHEERMKRKEIQSKLETQAQRLTKMEEGWNRLMQRMQQENQPKPPSFDEDPLEALRHQQEQQAKYLQQQHQTEQQRQQDYELNQRYQAFVNQCAEAVEEFKKSTPDYLDAYGYLKETRVKEFEALGYNQKQISQLIHDDEAAIAANAFQSGKNPAELIYNLAKTRGFQTPTQKQQAEQKMQQINKGVQMSKSLNSAGGKVSNDISLDALAQMSNDEFESFVAKNWDKVAKMVS
jgi:hypothetical protein